MIKVAKSDFEAALRVVSNTVSSNTPDISSHYLFRVVSGVLTLLSYSGRVFSSCPVIATSDEKDVSFSVEAWRIGNMLSATPNNSVLTFNPQGSEVKVVTDRGKIEFPSLDPSTFPFWDSVLETAVETANISADRLVAAFEHTRQFVSSDEQKTPQTCVVEFRGGCLYSSDSATVACIKVAGMEKSALRVHGKDLGPLIHFLSGAKGSSVSVLETPGALFIRRADGAVFGETKYAHSFPDFTVDWTLNDDYTWDIFREELLENVRFLQSGAQKGENKLSLELSDTPNVIRMGMAGVSGKTLTVDLQTQGMKANCDPPKPLPEDGFKVSHPHLSVALQGHSENLVHLGVARSAKGGWVRILDTRNGDNFLTVIAWFKKVA